MTESEKILAKEIQKLEIQNDALERKLKVATDQNFKLFQQCQDLSYYIKLLEGSTYGRS